MNKTVAFHESISFQRWSTYMPNVFLHLWTNFHLCMSSLLFLYSRAQLIILFSCVRVNCLDSHIFSLIYDPPNHVHPHEQNLLNFLSLVFSPKARTAKTFAYRKNSLVIFSRTRVTLTTLWLDCEINQLSCNKINTIS